MSASTAYRHPTVLDLGLSPCPNDTFLFAPLLDGRLRDEDLPLRFHLADVQELNEALAAGRLHVSKASFATALSLAGTLDVLPVGAALGFGVGPVLLARPDRAGDASGAVPGDALRALPEHAASGSSRDAGVPRLPADPLVLCPGAGTTATLLLRCLHPEWTRLEHVRFDAIMPALLAGHADAGVAIHEGRFTFAARGLSLVEDLGAAWERLTGAPVPLGGLFARRDLDPVRVARLCALLRRSLEMSRAEPERALPVMRRHAQEMDDTVLWRHVELYVNAHTADLGDRGRRSLDELARRSGCAAALRVFADP